VAENTERSNCRFVVKLTSDEKPFLVVQLYRDTIPALRSATIGFELLGGIRVEDANQLAEMLNEHVLEISVTTESG
jgi:hypothetical protein